MTKNEMIRFLQDEIILREINCKFNDFREKQKICNYTEILNFLIEVEVED